MSNPMTLEQMRTIADILLNHPKHGLLANTSTSNMATISLLDKLQTYLNSLEQVSREDWSNLKSSSLIEVGDASADCLSRICSAFRSPDVALSCFRDAAEKLTDLNAERTKKDALEHLRFQFKEHLSLENVMLNSRN